MKVIVQLHQNPYWYPAYILNGVWHITVDDIVTPVSKVCVKSWQYQIIGQSIEPPQPYVDFAMTHKAEPGESGYSPVKALANFLQVGAP